MTQDLRKTNLFQRAAWQEKKSKTVSFELPQSQGRYEWLKEIEFSEPTHLQELRKNSRDFLEKVKARRRALSDSANRPSESTKPAVLKSLSLPLRSNMHPKLKEKSFAKDDIYEETTESEPSRYEWWKEVEVERMLVEKVGGFRGNGRNEEEESL